MGSRAPSAAALRQRFLLDPTWTFLNHGSFGACPRPVFETYQRLQLELERQPLEFLDRQYYARLDAARERLAAYLGADVDGLVFMPNATAAVNTVARSLDLRAGDEVLTTDHEYGACVLAWRAVAADRDASLVTAMLPNPLSDVDAVLACLESAATERTRALFVSHLTASTAAVLPVAEICRWARGRGIVSIVDGAHAAGQLALDLSVVDADAYAGNCHKWLCAPKGAGFLWVAPELRDRVQPLVVSWGSEPGQPFSRRHGWGGTHDPAAALAVPAAIAFQDGNDWVEVRRRGTALAASFLDSVADRYGVAPLYGAGTGWHAQMVSVPLPIPGGAAAVLQQRLRDEWRIEVAVRDWQGRALIRSSFAGYNGRADAERLVAALDALLPPPR